MNDIMPHVHDFAPRLQFLKFTDESFRPAPESFKVLGEWLKHSNALQYPAKNLFYKYPESVRSSIIEE